MQTILWEISEIYSSVHPHAANINIMQ